MIDEVVVSIPSSVPISSINIPFCLSWFDGVGRSYYLQLTYKFGGKL